MSRACSYFMDLRRSEITQSKKHKTLLISLSHTFPSKSQVQFQVQHTSQSPNARRPTNQNNTQS